MHHIIVIMNKRALDGSSIPSKQDSSDKTLLGLLDCNLIPNVSSQYPLWIEVMSNHISYTIASVKVNNNLIDLRSVTVIMFNMKELARSSLLSTLYVWDYDDYRESISCVISSVNKEHLTKSVTVTRKYFFTFLNCSVGMLLYLLSLFTIFDYVQCFLRDVVGFESLVSEQIKLRISQLQQIQELSANLQMPEKFPVVQQPRKQDKRTLNEEKSNLSNTLRSIESFVFGRLCFMIMIDILLGVILLHWLLTNVSAKVLCDYFESIAEVSLSTVISF